ncbi:uncharacterized [Tachysurus ichikawai]
MRRLSLSLCSRLLFTPFQSAAIVASPSSQTDTADAKDEHTIRQHSPPPKHHKSFSWLPGPLAEGCGHFL